MALAIMHSALASQLKWWKVDFWERNRIYEASVVSSVSCAVFSASSTGTPRVERFATAPSFVAGTYAPPVKV